jgi:hypothetical protein
MKDIVPAILEKDFGEIKNKLAFLRGRAKTAAHRYLRWYFCSEQLWPFASGGFEDFDFQKIMNEEEGLPFWTDFDFELDLMVADAIENFNTYMKLGAKRMIFHLERKKI